MVIIKNKKHRMVLASKGKKGERIKEPVTKKIFKTISFLANSKSEPLPDAILDIPIVKMLIKENWFTFKKVSKEERESIEKEDKPNRRRRQ